MNQPDENLTLIVGPLVLPSRVDWMESEVVRLGRNRFLAQRRWPPIAGGATPKWYANGLKWIMSGAINLSATGTPDTIKLMLVTTSYVPAQASDDYADHFSTNEAIGGSGYPQYGWTLTGSNVTPSGLTVSWDSADISQAITGGPFAFRYGCFYKYRGASMGANEAIAYVDFGQQQVSDATIAINLQSQLSLTAS